MSVIYVVGPSGAGKSALCKKLVEQNSNFAHISLDDEVKRLANIKHLNEIVHLANGWEKFWNYCRQALNEISQLQDDRVYLVDAGAGSLQTGQGRHYFIENSPNLICVNGDEDVIYQRNLTKLQAQERSRSKDDFIETEFSLERRAVYGAAQYTVDTSQLDLNASLHVFQEAISAILKPSN